MNSSHILFSLVIAFSLMVSPSVGEANSSTASKRATTKKTTTKAKRKRSKRCRMVKGKRRCRRRSARHFNGWTAPKSSLRSEELARPSGKLWIYSVNFREEIKVDIFDEDGSVNEGAFAALDHGLRCKRTKQERAVDPKLYRLLSLIQDHFDGKRIDVVSGFRFQKNEGSRHFHASAIDIHIPGVPNKEVFNFAKTIDTGGLGIGYYPRAGFVHVDVRAPGEPSYRWIDKSGRNTGAKGKSPSRRWKRRGPNT